MKKLGLLYLVFIAVFMGGLIVVLNPYVESLLYVCVTYGDGHTECYYRTVRSFKLPLLLNGVLLIVTSIVNSLILTIVLLVLRSKRKKRRSIVEDVSNV
jgi:hypothetical protein